MPAPETSLFDRSVAVGALGDGRFGASIDPAWMGPTSPNGGILAAIMLRAAQARLGPDAPPPRAVVTHYLEPARAAAVEVAVDVLRAGKRVAACELRMRQAGVLVCQATIVFSASRPDVLALRSPPPSVPARERVPELDPGAIPGRPPVFRQLEMRRAFGALPFTGAAEALTGGWFGLRYDDAPIDPARLCALCDLWWPGMYAVLHEPAFTPTLQLTVHLRIVERTVRGPVLARFHTRLVSEGHFEESCELWSADGELLAESRQLALLVELPARGRSKPPQPRAGYAPRLGRQTRPPADDEAK